MKKLIYIITFLLILNIALAEESIYGYIKKTKQSPSEYIFVLTEELTMSESIRASNLSRTIGVKHSRTDISASHLKEKMLIIGNSENNKITKRLLGDLNFGKGQGIIKVTDNNLVIAAGKPKENRELLRLLNEHEKNKKIFSKDEYTIGGFSLGKETQAKTETPAPIAQLTEKLSKKTSFSLIWIILTIIGTGTVISLFLLKRKTQKTIPTNLIPLENYVQQNLSRGYTKEQIEQALLQQGWSKDKLDLVFNNIK